MAEHDDLDPEIRVRATEDPDQLKEAGERPVQERQGHRRMLAARYEHRQSPARGPRKASSAGTAAETSPLLLE